MPEHYFRVYKDNTYDTDCENQLWPLNQPFQRFQPVLHDDEIMTNDEQLIWRSLNMNHHVLVSGRAGSGKSHLIKLFIKHAKAANINLVVTSRSAVAAIPIEGTTIHRALGLGLAQDDPVTLWKRVESQPRKHKKTLDFLQYCDILLIDEVSMVEPQLFTTLDYLFRRARKVDKPFGGTLLLMIGDFKQIGAILPRYYTGPEDVRETEAYQSLQLNRIVLDRCWRQAEGPFLTLLDHVGDGYLTAEDEKLLESRLNIQLPIIDGLRPIELHSHNKGVDQMNEEKLNELIAKGEKRWRFQPVFHVKQREDRRRMDEDEVKSAEELIRQARSQDRMREPFRGKTDEKSLEMVQKIDKDNSLRNMFPVYEVELCAGAQAMMRSNHLFDQGICNGTTGIVDSVDDSIIKVKFFVRGVLQKVPTHVPRYEFKSTFGQTTMITMLQFPLSLAWCISQHKAQGSSVDFAVVHAENCFSNGMLYTALSRVRTLEGLSIVGFKKSSLKAKPSCVAYEALRDVGKKRKREDN